MLTATLTVSSWAWVRSLVRGVLAGTPLLATQPPGADELGENRANSGLHTVDNGTRSVRQVAGKTEELAATCITPSNRRPTSTTRSAINLTTVAWRASLLSRLP